MTDTNIKIYHDGEFEVWMGPADDLASDNIINAHIIGIGATKSDALTQAVAELEATLALIQETPDFPVKNIRVK